MYEQETPLMYTPPEGLSKVLYIHWKLFYSVTQKQPAARVSDPIQKQNGERNKVVALSNKWSTEKSVND